MADSFSRQKISERFSRLLRKSTANEQGVTEIGLRQIYIIPSRYGVIFALMALLMLIGSINYNNNLGFLLCFLLISLALVSMLHTWRNLFQLQIKIRADEQVFSGQSYRVGIQISDLQQRQRPAIQADSKQAAVQKTDLRAGQSATLELRLPAGQRGWQNIPRLRLFTVFPLGLFHAWTWIYSPQKILVYPKPGELPGINELLDYRVASRGDRGRGADDFVALREYQIGDSPRHIYWPAIARSDSLLCKQFGGDRAEQIWLDWKTTQGDTESRLSQLCAGLLQADRQQWRYGLNLPGLSINPDFGSKHLHRCLKMLALYPDYSA
ncbi:MAG: DUF58 domain-containing protein [gamma proteobacterium symbiont of Bathyaustriella thionipta]|nr:DUF58 domain-containing protein [gamma proteobacterium symbiont of Bathyaustriella thionipta]